MKRMNLLLSLFLSGVLFFNAQAVIPKEVNSIRIMSYNINNAIGVNETGNLDRIADIISDANPDIVALQGVIDLTDDSEIYLVDALGRRVLMHEVYSGTIGFHDDERGIGILSKEKPIKVEKTMYPYYEDVVIAEFSDFYFCCTYFLDDEVRAETLLHNILQVVKDMDMQKPFFLAGDMNSVYDSDLQKKIRENFNVLNNYKQNTYPADSPEQCVDFIYGYKNGNTYPVLSRRVLNEPQASTHRPVMVDVRFKADVNNIFRTKPYLQNPVGNGMTISWLTNVPVHSWVEYGENGKLDKRAELYVDGQMICNNKHHKIRLTGLEPGKTYNYRVCSREMLIYQAYYKQFGETAYSDVYSFTMPSDKTTDFTAVIFNDIHKNNGIVDKFSEQLKNINYDLVFFNGDCIDDPKNEDETVGFMSYMNEKVGAEKVPVIYLRGNHEIRNAYSIGLRDLFDYVNDKTYGAFSWGDTRIVMLDCGEDKPDSTWVYYGLNDFEGLRIDQVGFLKQELNSKEFKRAAKKVLIHHIPVYGNDDKYNPCLQLWGDQLSKAPFDVSIHGHTHRYHYHPKGDVGNNFPLVIGGGNRENSATMMVLEKKGNKMNLRVLNTEGEEKLKLEL